MRFTNPSAIIATAVALAAAPLASGLGINCRGSALCSYGACPGGLGTIKRDLDIAVGNGHGNDFFNTGTQVSCTGYCCAFFQSGATGTVQQVLNNVNALISHGCGVCGSNPTKPGNDVSMGQLTVNYVSNPRCGGYCYV